MTKVDIYSGFLGAGKTTLIKKLIKEAYAGQKIVLIENEFGEIGIDGGFLKEAGIEIEEMNSGCICCSLQGDFREALKMVIEQYAPDRIIIEPTGVGALSTVVDAAMQASDQIQICGLTTVVDVTKFKKYYKNFGEFFSDQVEMARVIMLSRTATADPEKIEEAAELMEMKNPEATVITANWEDIDGKELLAIIEGKDLLKEQLEALVAEHVDECDDPNCNCHNHDHHHHHEEHEHDHDHEHHDHEGHEHHDHDHEGHEHHHHHADEVFTSWGHETAKRYTKENIEEILKALDSEDYGMVLRAKGIVEDPDGLWIHFDYTPGEIDIRNGAAAPTGLLCVIGSHIDEEKIEALFGVAHKEEE